MTIGSLASHMCCCCYGVFPNLRFMETSKLSAMVASGATPKLAAATALDQASIEFQPPAHVGLALAPPRSTLTPASQAGNTTADPAAAPANPLALVQLSSKRNKSERLEEVGKVDQMQVGGIQPLCHEASNSSTATFVDLPRPPADHGLSATTPRDGGARALAGQTVTADPQEDGMCRAAGMSTPLLSPDTGEPQSVQACTHNPHDRRQLNADGAEALLAPANTADAPPLTTEQLPLTTEQLPLTTGQALEVVAADAPPLTTEQALEVVAAAELLAGADTQTAAIHGWTLVWKPRARGGRTRGDFYFTGPTGDKLYSLAALRRAVMVAPHSERGDGEAQGESRSLGGRRSQGSGEERDEERDEEGGEGRGARRSQRSGAVSFPTLTESALHRSHSSLVRGTPWPSVD